MCADDAAAHRYAANGAGMFDPGCVSEQMFPDYHFSIADAAGKLLFEVAFTGLNRRSD
jgi:hypothetical protein